jgi:hypothetical protein
MQKQLGENNQQYFEKFAMSKVDLTVDFHNNLFNVHNGRLEL